MGLLGPSTPIMVTDDLTRLTLATLALSSMDFRFNSCNHDKLDPFIMAMGNFLGGCGRAYLAPRFLLVKGYLSVLDARTCAKNDSEIS